MTINHPTEIPARANRLRRLTRAALFTAALSIGASAFAHPAIASAEWDIGEYDSCIQAGLGHNLSDAEWAAHKKYCCAISGGNWGPDAGGGNKCTAPAALQQVEPGPTVAPPVLQTVQPSPPVINVAPRGPNSGTLG
jgi:hypothetical protein